MTHHKKEMTSHATSDDVDPDLLDRVFELYDAGVISGATACDLLGLNPVTAQDESGFREKLRQSIAKRKKAAEW